MAVNNGTALSLYIDGTKVAVCTTHTLTFEKETIEVTSKDSGGWAEFISGKKSATASAEGFVDPDSSHNFDELYDIITSDSNVTFKYTDEVVGNYRYEGNLLITSLERSSEFESAESFSVEFQVTGQPSKVSIT